MIKHIGFKDRTGQKFTTREGYEIEIIEYFGVHNCTIKFKNGYLMTKQHFKSCRDGTIKNHYHKSIYGIGFLGKGNYTGFIKGKSKKSYSIWKGIIQRCYSKISLLRAPTYADCYVHSDWHNYQNFAKWFYENYNPEIMEGWNLDKDILAKGNKIYSSETCCFVPKEINSIFVNKNSTKGKYPVGVSYKAKQNRYEMSICKLDKREFKSFKTAEEAIQAYKKEKEQYIKKVADKWKDTISPIVYKAMYDFEIEIE